MKQLFAIFAFAVIPAALAAQDGCPVAADLDGDGVAFFSADGVEVHTRAPNGVVTIVTDEDEDGIAVKSVLAHGVHVLQLSDLENGQVVPGSVWRFAFPMPVADLPAPTPGGGWSVGTTSMIDGVSETEVITYTWGTPEAYGIGPCTYEAIPVRASYDGDSYDHVEDSVYFPALGTALLIRYGDDDGTETYTFTDIKAR